MPLNKLSLEIDIKNIEKLNPLLHESLELVEQLKLKINELNQSSIDKCIDSFVDKLEATIDKLSVTESSVTGLESNYTQIFIDGYEIKEPTNTQGMLLEKEVIVNFKFLTNLFGPQEISSFLSRINQLLIDEFNGIKQL